MIKRLIQIVSAACLLIMASALVTQAASRTFVSSTGTDAGTCPRTAPCAGFAYALTQTDPGGTIVALDTAAYGGVTINQSVTIEGVGGALGLIKVQPSTSGIMVTGGSPVILRNLKIEGFGGSNTIGVNQTGGNSLVEVVNCQFTGLTTAIRVSGLSGSHSRTDLIDVDCQGNGTAVFATGAGVQGPGNPQPAEVFTLVRINGGNFTGNTTGWDMDNPGFVTFMSNNFQSFNIAVLSNAIINNVGNTANNTICTGTCVNSNNNPISYGSGQNGFFN